MLWKMARGDALTTCLWVKTWKSTGLSFYVRPKQRLTIKFHGPIHTCSDPT